MGYLIVTDLTDKFVDWEFRSEDQAWKAIEDFLGLETVDENLDKIMITKLIEESL